MDSYYDFIIKELSSGTSRKDVYRKIREKDLDAVENSVASSLSNGFVEGTNSKLKMVKRTMYGKVINYG
ncbi:transposase [Chryseobacterium sp.]|uniref:transposase n=1 Tax=Chryseobacterium sp. TaxID=1871047 RepID=UPI002FC7CD56